MGIKMKYKLSSLLLSAVLFIYFSTFSYSQERKNNVNINFITRIEIVDFEAGKNNSNPYTGSLRFLSTTGIEANIIGLNKKVYPYIMLAYTTDFIRPNDQRTWGRGLTFGAGLGTYLMGDSQKQVGFTLTTSLGYSLKAMFQDYYGVNSDNYHYNNEPFLPMGGEFALKANYIAYSSVFSVSFSFGFYKSEEMIGFSKYYLNDGWALSYGINLSYGFNL